MKLLTLHPKKVSFKAQKLLLQSVQVFISFLLSYHHQMCSNIDQISFFHSVILEFWSNFQFIIDYFLVVVGSRFLITAYFWRICWNQIIQIRLIPRLRYRLRDIIKQIFRFKSLMDGIGNFIFNQRGKSKIFNRGNTRYSTQLNHFQILISRNLCRVTKSVYCRIVQFHKIFASNKNKNY